MPKTRKQGKSDNVSDLSTIPGARLAPLPLSVSPMLASIPTGPVGNDGWIFEPKTDGIRCIAIISGGSARLLSRRGLDLTNQYPVLAAELPSRVNGNAVIDGEIIALDAKGHPSFQQLQQRMNLTGPADIDRAEKTVPVYFYAFDIVHFDNHDLTRVRLMQRKMLLSQVVMESDRVRILSSFEGDGVLAYEACVENGFEGIVAKRKESFYESGRRSPSWLKVKIHQTAEFVIGGYTTGRGSRGTSFGALLLGYYDAGGNLVYCGSVGTGFDDRTLSDTLRRLAPIGVKSCPFVRRPQDKRDCVWTEPKFVAEIKYMAFTRDGHLRAPVFLRFRDDKLPSEIVHPDAQLSDAVSQAVTPVPPRGRRRSTAIVYTSDSHPAMQVAESLPVVHGTARDIYRDVLDQLSGNERALELIIGSERLSLTHLDKVFWPATELGPAITKREYLRLLCSMAPHLLPHWQARPLTLFRAPEGVSGKAFFQKNWHTNMPDFVETVALPNATGQKEFLLCNNLPSLLFFAQHSVLEFHSFSSRIANAPDPVPGLGKGSSPAAVAALLEHPDYLILDLDYHPHSTREKIETFALDAFRRTAEVALELKENLEAVSLTPFVKLSGRNGLHIFVPVKRAVDFSVTRTLADTIARYLVSKKPQSVTMEVDIRKRAGKVYLDCSANGPGKTLACAYSARAIPWGAVSAPIAWSELSDIQPADLALCKMPQRLASIGDPWAGIMSAKQDVNKAFGSKTTR